MPLLRQNAFTPLELKNMANEELLTNTFCQNYTLTDKDDVYKFFSGMLKYQRSETMEKFCAYHSCQDFSKIFPPVDIYAIWNAWNK